jgi:hypothetical protein
MKRMESVAPDDFSTINKRVKLKVHYLPVHCTIYIRKDLFNNFSEIMSTYCSSLGRYVFGSEISYNKAPPRLPGLGC